MSEYQYYEFMAIDGPISDEGLRYARACSNRASVSRVRWQNTYHLLGFRPLMDQKASAAYQQVAAQLQELRDAHAQADDVRTFDQKLAEFRRRYSNRPGMLRRIEEL